MLPSQRDDPPPTLAEARAEAEMQVILAALERSGGRRKAAAKLLGLSEATLYRKLAILRRRSRLERTRRPPSASAFIGLNSG